MAKSQLMNRRGYSVVLAAMSRPYDGVESFGRFTDGTDLKLSKLTNRSDITVR